MQWLAQICIRRPVFASVLILTLTVVGAVGFSRLGVDRFPKVDFPTIVITTRQPGAAPEQIETEISDKIEEAVNTISGVDELRSTSSEGVSLVVVSFVLEKIRGRRGAGGARQGQPATFEPLRASRYYGGNMTRSLVGGKADAYDSPDDLGPNQEFWIEVTLVLDPSIRFVIADSDDAPLGGGQRLDGVYLFRNGVLQHL